MDTSSGIILYIKYIKRGWINKGKRSIENKLWLVNLSHPWHISQGDREELSATISFTSLHSSFSSLFFSSLTINPSLSPAAWEGLSQQLYRKRAGKAGRKHLRLAFKSSKLNSKTKTNGDSSGAVPAGPFWDNTSLVSVVTPVFLPYKMTISLHGYIL